VLEYLQETRLTWKKASNIMRIYSITLTLIHLFLIKVQLHWHKN